MPEANNIMWLTPGAHAQRGLRYLVAVSVLPSVPVFCDYAQRDNKIAVPTGSSLHWLHFKKGDFHITAAFKSYGVKSK